MAPGSIASPKQCQEAEELLQPRINPLEAEDGEKNLLPWEAHPADSCWLMLEGCAHHGGEDTTQKDPFALTCLCSSFTHISGGELAL